MRRGQTRESGVTVLELMMSLAIGLIVLAALLLAFDRSSRNRIVQEAAAQVIENGRYAMSVLNAELPLAGFYGSLSAPPATATLDAPCSSAVADWQNSLMLHARGSNQNDGAFPCVARKADTDAILIQRAATCVSGPSAESGCDALQSGTAYMQVSECGPEYALTPFVLTTMSGSASATFPLAAIQLPTSSSAVPTCAAAGSAPVRKFYRSIYYIDDSGTLNRLDLSAGAAPSEPGTVTAIAAGIENLQIEYAIDTNGDGLAETYSSAPASDQWPSVVGARISLLARAESRTAGYQDDKTYVIGDACSLPPGAADCSSGYTSARRSVGDQSYKRHAFISYVGFMQPLGRRQR